MQSKGIIVLGHYQMSRLIAESRRRLDNFSDGNTLLCEAGDLWQQAPDKYLGMNLVEPLLGMALHPNSQLAPADCLRDNLMEDRGTDDTDTLDYAGLCKLQAFNATHFLCQISRHQPETFTSGHIDKLLTYCHLAEGNVLCASGNEGAYQCIQNLAFAHDKIFTRHHLALMALKSELDLRPVTRTEDINPYHNIICSLGVMPAMVRPLSYSVAPVRPMQPSPKWRLAANDARF